MLCQACRDSAALLTLEDAAALLSCSRDFLRRAARDGRVPSRRLGNRFRFDRKELLAALDQAGGATDGGGA